MKMFDSFIPALEIDKRNPNIVLRFHKFRIHFKGSLVTIDGVRMLPKGIMCQSHVVVSPRGLRLIFERHRKFFKRFFMPVLLS